MQLSAFSIVDAYPAEEGRGRDRLAEVVALAEAAEAGGLAGLWVAEHHFHEGGVCPAPPVLLAAAAARTRRLRLGAMVSVLPFHRSVDLAEEYAMVDRLSHGRLNLGLGSGYIGVELDAFGVPLEGRRERFERTRAEVLDAFAGRPIRPAGPEGPEVVVNVRPVQSPHPPLWVAVQRREAIPFVARQRARLALIPYATLPDLGVLAEEIAEYRAALPAGERGWVSVGLHLYAGEAVEEARRALQRFLDSRRRTQSRHYAEKVRHDPRQASAAAIEEAGWALFGAPDDVAARLTPFERAGVDEVLGIFDFGGLAPALVERSVLALGRARAVVGSR